MDEAAFDPACGRASGSTDPPDIETEALIGIKTIRSAHLRRLSSSERVFTGHQAPCAYGISNPNTAIRRSLACADALISESDLLDGSSTPLIRSGTAGYSVPRFEEQQPALQALWGKNRDGELRREDK